MWISFRHRCICVLCCMIAKAHNRPNTPWVGLCITRTASIQILRPFSWTTHVTVLGYRILTPRLVFPFFFFYSFCNLCGKQHKRSLGFFLRFLFLVCRNFSSKLTVAGSRRQPTRLNTSLHISNLT